MGAYPLEDHKMVHRIIGIKRLLAFDLDEKTVKRQEFNRPVASCKCIAASSGNVVDEFDNVMKDHKLDDANGFIVWLDYTSPSQIHHQVREFQTLIDKLKDGDIVRVTVNAHLNDQVDMRAAGKPIPVAERRKTGLEKLHQRIGEYLPSTASPTDMTEEGFPLLLSSAFGSAVHKAFPPNGSKTFQPLSIIRYADGQQMLTITGLVIERDNTRAMLTALDLKNWPFASSDWNKVHHLVVPSLTLRERLFFEREVGGRVDRIEKKLGFTDAAGLSVRDFLRSYKNYYRFYPSLLSVDV